MPLFVEKYILGGLISYLRYLCLLAYSGVFLLCLPSSCVLCTQCCQFFSIVHFLITPSVFSNA